MAERRSRRRAAAALLVVLAVLQLSALFVPREAVVPWPFSLFVRAVPALAAGIQTVGNGIGDAWEAWVANRHAARELQAMRRERDELRFALAWTRGLLDRRAAFDQAFGWARSPWDGVVGRVVFHDPGNRDRAVWMAIEGESRDVVGHAVVADAVLIGRIVRQNGMYGQVLLLRDAESAVDVQSESGVRGIVMGTGGERARLGYVPSFEGLAPGETLISTGRDGVFPEGWPVGVVTRIDRRPESLHLDAEVRLFAAVGAVGTVRTVPVVVPDRTTTP